MLKKKESLKNIYKLPMANLIKIFLHCKLFFCHNIISGGWFLIFFNQFFYNTSIFYKKTYSTHIILFNGKKIEYNKKISIKTVPYISIGG